MASKVTELKLKPVAAGIDEAIDDMTRPAPGVAVTVVTPEPAYSKASLEAAIEAHQAHIGILEDSITEAHGHIKELRRHLRELDE
jgi:hypothetical protein